MIRAGALPGRPMAGLGENLRTALAAGGVLLFYTSVDLYAYQAWSTPSPLIWTFFFVAVGLASAVSEQRRVTEVARTPLAMWLLVFFLVTTLWAVFAPNVPTVQQALADRYRSIALLVALMLLLAEPAAHRGALLALAAGVAAGASLNVAESFGLQFAENPARVAGRAAGLYVNPNGSGLALTLGLAAIVPRLSGRWHVPFLLLGLAGVTLTFSRSSMLVYAALLAVLLVARVVRIGPVTAAALVVAMALGCFGDALWRTYETSGVLNQNTQARLRLEVSDSGRLEVAQRAWRLWLDSPLLGQGIGATADWDAGAQPHNEYLTLGAEHGVVGLALFPALVTALAIGGRAVIPFCSVLLLAGIFSHGLLTERPMLLLLALVGTSRVSTCGTERGR